MIDVGTKRHRSKYVDLTGMHFGHWTVVGRAEKRSYGGTYWVCQCDCGNTSEVDGKDLKNGRSTNCGCSNRWKKFHGLMGAEPRLSKTWNNMMQRCYNSSMPNYRHYGGRGISVCDEWHDLKNFVEWAYSTGYENDAPRGKYTLERVDVNGNYCPDNCRWATAQEQLLNKRTSVFLTIDGVTKNISTWAKDVGESRANVSYWLKRYGNEETIRRIKQRQLTIEGA
jgi:hypothetical protein